VPFERFAVAVNCADVPTVTVSPLPATVTDVTVGAGVLLGGVAGAVVALGEGVDEELLLLPHAHATSASVVAHTTATSNRRIVTFSKV
jgi:hypothetical protein